ncbi:hypothetical protein KSP40_PGU009529 [Platanthera guangdongensis]|uniref:Transcription factor TFIIIC triple barrel domain-containing protein n=1 Tax=Platanthera guangdongensis TaxID=2320717 RepID=A0ABR2LRF3_9ASPA
MSPSKKVSIFLNLGVRSEANKAGVDGSFVQKGTDVGVTEEAARVDVVELGGRCLFARLSTRGAACGLDTLNPVLCIGDRLKLIGEYQETIGTCFLFSEEDTEMVVSTEPESSGVDFLASQQYVSGPNEAPAMQIRHAATAHKVLKFRLHADP